jgi:hypothetical protein
MLLHNTVYRIQALKPFYIQVDIFKARLPFSNLAVWAPEGW